MTTAAAQVNFGDSEVPLPAGADAASTWEDWNGEFRCVSTQRRMIDGTTCAVWASAIQLPDGTIADGTLEDGTDEEPLITVEGQDGVTTAQARELAQRLIDAADLLDGWAGRTPRAQDTRLPQFSDRLLEAAEDIESIANDLVVKTIDCPACRVEAELDGWVTR
jgi:hypothetical protein